MLRLLRSVFRFLCYLGLGCLVVIPAGAAEHIITSSVRVRETYDDNLFFYDVADFEHLIAPALKLNSRTERAALSATAAWNISEYERHSQLDTVDQSYQLSGEISPTSRAQLELLGNYVRDYTFTEALEELGVVTERSTRTWTSALLGATIALTPRNRLEGSYSFDKTQYQLDCYPDYRAQGLSLTWVYDQMNERTSTIFQLGGTQVDYATGDGDLRQQTWQGLVGIDHQFTETLQMTLQAGARHTESKFPKTVRERDTAFVLHAHLAWHSERMTVSAQVTRDFVPSIYGEDITRDRVSASLRYRLREHLHCDFTATYHHSETEGLIRTEEHETYAARPMVSYRFSEHTSLALGYAYTRTKNEITDRSDERNHIFVQVSTEWPHYFN